MNKRSLAQQKNVQRSLLVKKENEKSTHSVKAPFCLISVDPPLHLEVCESVIFVGLGPFLFDSVAELIVVDNADAPSTLASNR